MVKNMRRARSTHLFQSQLKECTQKPRGPFSNASSLQIGLATILDLPAIDQTTIHLSDVSDQMFVLKDTPFGPLELRMTVTKDNFTGYWAGPFGQNGKLSGKKELQFRS